MLLISLLWIAVAIASVQSETCSSGGKTYKTGEHYEASDIRCKMITCGKPGEVHYGCVSQLDNKKCIEHSESEDLDCVTYTCTYEKAQGHGVLVKNVKQEPRCSIGGKCYSAGEGPNVCTYCQKNNAGGVGIMAGCMTRAGKCIPPGAEFIEGCDNKICTVRDSAVSFHTVATMGCELEKKCYSEGAKTYRYTCNTCKVDPILGFHTWYRECRDVRSDHCFKKGMLNDFFCNTFICNNRNGIGWHKHKATHCQVSAKDCVAYNSTSMRNGLCYFCDSKTGGTPRTICKACGQCLFPGKSVKCAGKVYKCDPNKIPPPQALLKCFVGDQLIELNKEKTINCNTYKCTRYGVRQLTKRCSYKGKCCDVGIIDADRCIMCVQEGMTAAVKGGCKLNGKCYREKEMVRVNCRAKQCMNHGNVMSFVDTAIQPTPCRCHGSCYPVGPFTYALDRVCAECFKDGTIKYSCKLANGDCLGIDQEEKNPMLGCYRMKCTFTKATSTLTLARAPGQPLMCSVPDGTCLKENEEKIIKGLKYICIANDVCLIGNKKVKVGDSVIYNCHEVVCEETIAGGKKRSVSRIKEYGCAFGARCKKLNDVFDINCDIYKCQKQSGKTYATAVKIKNRCSCDSICLDIGMSYWTSTCLKKKCDTDGVAKPVVAGCKSKLLGTCLIPGQEITVNGKTEKCVSTDNTGGSGNHVCSFASGQQVPYKKTVDVYCNKYICDRKDNFLTLFVVGEARCQLTYNGIKECFKAGTSSHCIKCNFDSKSLPQKLTMTQTCEGDGGKCVEPGKTAMYKCDMAKCNKDTYNMDYVDKKNCHYNGICISKDKFTVIDYKSMKIKCKCKVPKDNKLDCYRA